MPDLAREAAAEAAASMIADDLDVAGTEVLEQLAETVADAPEAQHETVPEPEPKLELEPELPDEIKQLVEEPDFEKEVDQEFEWSPQAQVREDEDYEYEDPDTAELKRQLALAQKKAAWFEAKRLEEQRGKWVAEAEKYFPLADVEKIDATSRRAFIRAAKEQHDSIKGRLAKFGAEGDKILADARVEAARIIEEAKAQAAEAWGKPTVPLSPQPPVPRKEDREAVVNSTIRRRGLAAGIKEMFATEEVT